MTNSTLERSTALVREVPIPIDGRLLAGDLNVPAAAKGIVLFAHGSGSSRHSARNRFVAERMRDADLGHWGVLACWSDADGPARYEASAAHRSWTGVAHEAAHRRVGPTHLVGVEPQVEVHELGHVGHHLVAEPQRLHAVAGHASAPKTSTASFRASSSTPSRWSIR